MAKQKGKLITILGVTNVGKTTQLKLLEERLLRDGLKFKILKYPMYSHEPTGPRAYAFLKGGNPENLTAKDFQEICAQNRKDFEPELLELLNENDVVIGEMYVGTGLAYGVGDGVSKDYLLEINQGILEPDLSILLDGNRYLESREAEHIYEKDDDMTEKIRKIHLDLASEFGWDIVDANKTREDIHEEIYEKVKKVLKK